MNVLRETVHCKQKCHVKNCQWMTTNIKHSEESQNSLEKIKTIKNRWIFSILRYSDIEIIPAIELFLLTAKEASNIFSMSL